MKFQEEKEYQRRLTNSLMKILYLYEEENEFLGTYVDRVLTEIESLELTFKELDKRGEYVQFITLMERVSEECHLCIFDKFGHNLVRNNILYFVNHLIPKLGKGD